MILRYLLYWLPNILLVFTAWGILPPALILFGYSWWFGLLFLFSAPALAGLSLLTGPKLPGFLQWFSTTDADLDGGIAQNVAGYKAGLKGFALWWQRTSWICRNPAHGWQAEVLGMSTDGLVTIDQKHNGKNHWFLFVNGKRQRFFCIKRDVPLFGGWYVKFYAGWYDVARDGRNHQYEFQIVPKRA